MYSMRGSRAHFPAVLPQTQDSPFPSSFLFLPYISITSITTYDIHTNSQTSTIYLNHIL